MENSLRSALSRAKGLGSAKGGSHHWLHQRITAIILGILAIWVVCFIKCTITSDVSTFIARLQRPYNIVPFVILVITSFYHSMSGLRIIIEDYISSTGLRTFLIILLQIFCMVTVVSFVVAVFYLMIHYA